MRGMYLIVPPTCDLTVPLLGVYQLAGYAKSRGLPFAVGDFNIELCKVIISYSTNRARSLCGEECQIKERLDEYAIAKFLMQYPEIVNYESILNSFKICDNAQDYWELVDYLRACYDMYSLQFHDIRFRIDGFDCKHRWNLWADIKSFVDEYSDSPIMVALSDMVAKSDFCRYEIIGISVTFESQLFFALLLCKALRAIRPDVKIVIGGGFINTFIDCAEAMGPIADYCNCVFSGEGEALIEYLVNGQGDISIIGKAAYLNSARYVIPKNVCDKLLHVQPPHFTSANLLGQFSPKRIVPLRFSYDCYWGKCKFCSDKESHDCLEKKYDLQRVVAYVIDEVSNGRIDGIYFLDSAIRPRDVELFASALVNAKQTIPWGTNLRFEHAFDDDKLIALMVRSGFVFAKFGLESGSQDVLDSMNKGTDVIVAASITSKFRKHGIFVHTYVMVAYPGETEDDRQKTEDFLLSEYSHPDNYNCSEFILYGGASIAQDYEPMLKTGEVAGDGWYSSEYDFFTNKDIQTFIASMRQKFDERYKPQSVLMSTGHTIAYADVFKPKLAYPTESRYITFSWKVMYTSMEGVACLLWWNRNRGCSYIVGKWAATLHDALVSGISKDDFSRLNLPEAVTEILWSDSCLCMSEDGVKIESKWDVPADPLKIFQSDRVTSLNWYGQYDAS